MTGTPLLIGQIVTALIFIAFGLGLVFWLFRGDSRAPAQKRRPGTAREVRIGRAPPAPPEGEPPPR